MKLYKYNSLCLILLALSSFFFAWLDPIDSNIALAQVSTPTGLVPAPSLQAEQPEGLTSDTDALPPEVKTAVLEDAVQRTSRTVAALRILQAEKQTWSDGCLGLAEPNELCTQVLVPGWQVVVTDGRRNWTYRTDDSGSLVKLEELPQ